VSRVVGGVFALEPPGTPRGQDLPFLRGPHLLLANARGGLRLLLQARRPATLWMPAFLCESMLRIGEGLPVATRLYAIDEAFATTDLAWLDEVRAGDVVVVVDYFGHVLHGDVAARARDRGAIVVEDASHALLGADAGSLGDYVLWSPRKFAGLPDGGVLQARRDAPLPDAALPDADAGWWQAAYEACARRAGFDAGGPRDFLPWHQQAERDHPADAVAMSTFSRERLDTLDWPAIARRRRANHDVLADRLARFAALPPPATGTVPAGFTVRVPQRDAVRAALFARDIYPSLLWPAGPVPTTFAASHRLAAEVMTLHCDQRYDAADMARTADAIFEAVRP
jgi:hypothetical protein